MLNAARDRHGSARRLFAMMTDRCSVPRRGVVVVREIIFLVSLFFLLFPLFFCSTGQGALTRERAKSCRPCLLFMYGQGLDPVPSRLPSPGGGKVGKIGPRYARESLVTLRRRRRWLWRNPPPTHMPIRKGETVFGRDKPLGPAAPVGSRQPQNLRLPLADNCLKAIEKHSRMLRGFPDRHLRDNVPCATYWRGVIMQPTPPSFLIMAVALLSSQQSSVHSRVVVQLQCRAVSVVDIQDTCATCGNWALFMSGACRLPTYHPSALGRGMSTPEKLRNLPGQRRRCR